MRKSHVSFDNIFTHSTNNSSETRIKLFIPTLGFEIRSQFQLPDKVK